jgi:putative heme-binding domain-containing protein
MNIARTVVLVGLLAAGAATAFAQERSGESMFRERCSECHGADAKGVAGHDLTRLWAAGATDDRVFQTIRQGVPNTIMPSSTAPDNELRAIVSYLRGLGSAAARVPISGNVQNGERIFSSSCGTCHAINGRGGPLGPDLSQIGQTQGRELLVRAVRDPNASIPDGFKPVTILTRDGQRVHGVRKSEDAFSIQIMDEHGRLRGYLKSNVREIVRESNSLMPAFGADRLSDNDLADVLAYLGTLKATGEPR